VSTATVRARVGRRLPTRFLGGDLMAAFGSLVTSQLLAAGLGFAFWIAAARLVDPKVVGQAAAAVSSITLAGSLAVLGCGTLLIRELPLLTPSRRSAVLRSATVVMAVSSSLLALLWLGPGRLINTSLRAALHSPGTDLLFCLAVVCYAITWAMDQAVLGLKRPGLQVARNVLAAAGRFPIALVLVAAGIRSTGGLLASWMLPIAASMGLVWWKIRRARDVPKPTNDVRADIRLYWRAALGNHGLNTSLQVSSLLIPVVAASFLVPSSFAYFSIAWQIATFAFVPPFMLSIALFAVSANEAENLGTRMRTTLVVGMATSVACIIVVIASAGLVLHIFGAEYAKGGEETLRTLVLAGIPLVIKDHYLAKYRVEQRMAAAVGRAFTASIWEAGAAVLGAVFYGAEGLCIAWCCAMGLEALVMLPPLVKLLRGSARATVPVDLAAEPAADLLERAETLILVSHLADDSLR
jgi:O-antigen/teichoic acid export membrane protein